MITSPSSSAGSDGPFCSRKLIIALNMHIYSVGVVVGVAHSTSGLHPTLGVGQGQLLLNQQF